MSTMRLISVELTIGEVAEISQRALIEKITGNPYGVFSGLWDRIQERLREDKSPTLKIKKATLPK